MNETDSPPPARASYPATERLVYRGCLAYMLVTSGIWLYFVITQADGGVLFAKYNPTLESLAAVLMMTILFWFGWSYGWYGLKRWLLKRIGIPKSELDLIFSTRRDGFQLSAVLEKYPERKIRILDMIGRRGRAAMMALVAFSIMYFEIRRNPGPNALTSGIQSNYFEAIFVGWWFLLTYRSNGLLGKATYGAQARIMDGVLARANCILIATLWGAFKFVMIPIGMQLNKVFPDELYAVLFLYVWLSYLAGDTASEVIGALFGKQKLEVWGVGEVNKKSVEGTVSCFVFSLLVCLLGVISHELSFEWVILALVISLANTIVELWAPRGTDDFFMATTNALLCWGFGLLILT